MKLKLLLLWGLAAILCPSASAEPLMITHLKGSVINQNGQAIKLLTKVDTGQVLSVPKGAVVTLTSLKDGTRYTLEGESKAKVNKESVTLLKGRKSKMTKLDGRQGSLQAPQDISSSMGGILHRSSSSTPRILSVGNLSEPVLHWEEFPQALRYEVTIEKPGQGGHTWETQDLSAPLSMDPEIPYLVTLAVVVKGPSSVLQDSPPEEQTLVSTATVTLLSQDLPESLKWAKDSESKIYADSDDSSELAIVFSELFQHRLYFDALQLLERAKHHKRALATVRSYLFEAIDKAQESSP